MGLLSCNQIQLCKTFSVHLRTPSPCSDFFLNIYIHIRKVRVKPQPYGVTAAKWPQNLGRRELKEEMEKQTVHNYMLEELGI